MHIHTHIPAICADAHMHFSVRKEGQGLLDSLCASVCVRMCHNLVFIYSSFQHLWMCICVRVCVCLSIVGMLLGHGHVYVCARVCVCMCVWWAKRHPLTLLFVCVCICVRTLVSVCAHVRELLMPAACVCVRVYLRAYWMHRTHGLP
eukprot:GDKI01016538.1.p1 GENE.GDKI01016538.1~~GDKI01016538.1.p1  ORF type:complete len:147 (+),score=46.81 GDKI01016538.1:243-683(+)